MQSQPQNPEFRINPENLHPWWSHAWLLPVPPTINTEQCRIFAKKINFHLWQEKLNCCCICTVSLILGYKGLDVLGFPTKWDLNQSPQLQRLISKWNFTFRHRGSYTSVHVLLNLLNGLGKSDKIWGLPSILSHFRKTFNKFNTTGAWMLDSIYHMTLNFSKVNFWRENVKILPYFT